jgi:hypothetical protein
MGAKPVTALLAGGKVKPSDVPCIPRLLARLDGRAKLADGLRVGSPKREAVRPHTVLIRCGGGTAPRDAPEKRNCYFGYLWLFLVIFVHNIHCNSFN